MGIIDRVIGVFSIVLGLILVVIGINKGYLDINDIHIMYWLIGFVIGIYLILWLGFIGFMWRLFVMLLRKIFGY